MPDPSATSTAAGHIAPPTHLTNATGRHSTTHESGSSSPNSSILGNLIVGAAVSVATAFFVWSAIARGQDWSFDSHGYHNVYAYANLFERDQLGEHPLALGAYFNPVLDVPLGWGVRNLSPRVVTIGLALVQSIGLCAAALLPWRFMAGRCSPEFGDGSRTRTIVIWSVVFLAGLALAYGAFGQIQLGATFGDLTSAVPAVLGIHALLDWTQRRTNRMLLAAGFLFAVSVGLKYTNGPSLLGALACVVLTAAMSPEASPRVRSVAMTVLRFLGSVVLGLALVIGPWWIVLLARYGNPFFPFGGRRLNEELGRSDGTYLDLGSHVFAIRSLSEFLGEPVHLLGRSTAVTEMPVRDPRLFVSAVCCLLIVSVHLVGRIHAQQRGADTDDGARQQVSSLPDVSRSAVARQLDGLPAAGFWIVSYASWAFLFGNGRYLQLIELMTPLMVTIAVCVVVAHIGQLQALPLMAMALLVVAAAVAVPSTISPELNHVPFGNAWYDFDLTAVPPMGEAMVIVPYEYEPQDFAIFLLEPAAFVRLNSALLSTRLADAERARIVAFDGPIYSFQATNSGDANLRAVGLERTGPCVTVAASWGFDYFLCPLGNSSHGATKSQGN